MGHVGAMTNSDAFLSAEALMTRLGWLPSGRSVAWVTIAGAGNMNQVERVGLDDGKSLILKRAHPWVQKYPDIPAPVARAAVEAAFYHAVSGQAAGTAMPAHLGHDTASAANLFEDLGEGRDGMSAYTGEPITRQLIEDVADWMRALHSLPPPFAPILANHAMRELNALHIFDFPLDPNNGFNLDAITPGLQACADTLKHDRAFTAMVATMKARYLGHEGGVLLHGDLYPGSWLTTERGLFIIDPEFCWIGPREWDVGILCAHMRLSGQSPSLETDLITRYGAPLDRTMLNRFIGIEIMRRLIGVAQLPLAIDLDAKAALLADARSLVIGNRR